MKQSPLIDKSFDFALEIIRQVQELQVTQKEYVLTKQILRSGTAIGALLHEAEFAASHADYINKFTVALKETNESSYWLKLLHYGAYLNSEKFEPLHQLCTELIAMLVTAIKTLKRKASKADV